MKIAYLHGLESTIDPKDPKLIWLNDNFTEVYTPQINYKNPGEFDKILRHIKKMNPLYIVGSSMGGYFSYLIGSKLGIKTILFNPAVIGRSFEPVVNVGGIKGAAHNVYFGKSDKVIDGMEVRKYFGSEGAGDFQYNYYNGGHRVPVDVFIGAIKETSGITEIYNIENKSTTMIKKFEQFVEEANELKKPTYAPHMDSDDVFFLWDQHFDSRDGIEHGIVKSGNKEYSQFEFGDNINSTSFKYFKKDLEKLANKNRWDFSIDSDSLEIYESINESEVVYNQFDFEGMWAQKLGMTREEYVAHFATMTVGVDEAKVKDASGKKFEVKGISFTYVEQTGKFYGAYLFDVAKTSNVKWRQKLRSISEVTELLKLYGISNEIPYKYNENELDTICAELRTQGIECDHNDHFDVS